MPKKKNAQEEAQTRFWSLNEILAKDGNFFAGLSDEEDAEEGSITEEQDWLKLDDFPVVDSAVLDELKRYQPNGFSWVVTEAQSREETKGKTCMHCKAEKTRQWREGPDGPMTLCNACGLRYKKYGEIPPEYRPAKGPTFSAAVHSNYRSIIKEMRRQKLAGKDDAGSTSNPMNDE